MKCGVGKCGRCNIGPVYVCKDGPVFTPRNSRTAAGVLTRWGSPAFLRRPQAVSKGAA